jgi:hypothetical protein
MSRVRHTQRSRRVAIMAGLAGLSGALAILSGFGPESGPPSSARTGTPVIPQFERLSAGVTAIRVTLADGSYVLEDTGAGWTLRGTGGYPVRADRLAELSSGLASLAWEAPRTSDTGKFNRIGLGDPREGGTGALLELLDASGAATAGLITGRKDGHIYARLPGELAAYRVKGELPPLYVADAWLDLDILDVSADTIQSVRLTDARGQTLFLRRNVGGNETDFRPGPPQQDWRLVGRTAAAGPALAITRFQPVGVKPAGALTGAPIARHVTETHDGLEIEVQAFRESDGMYVTLRAIEAGHGARRGETINDRARGWAFLLAPADWSDFAPDIRAIARPPETSN